MSSYVIVTLLLPCSIEGQNEVYFHMYTGVVYPKPTIGKPCNGQRNVHYCMRGTKTANEKNIK